jgi:hypothetical protein
MRPKASAIWPTSSFDVAVTFWSSSPRAMPSAAFSIWRTPPVICRVMRRATTNARPRPTTIEPMPNQKAKRVVDSALALAAACSSSTRASIFSCAASGMRTLRSAAASATSAAALSLRATAGNSASFTAASCASSAACASVAILPITGSPRPSITFAAASALSTPACHSALYFGSKVATYRA